MRSSRLPRENLPGRTLLPYINRMDGMTIPPELERFAEQAVASGRYRDLSEVVAAGISLLQRQETTRAAFIRSLEDAQAEAERDGWHSLEDVMAEADDIIASMRDQG